MAHVLGVFGLAAVCTYVLDPGEPSPQPSLLAEVPLRRPISCFGSDHSGELHPGPEDVCEASVTSRIPQVSGRPLRLLRAAARGAPEDGEVFWPEGFASFSYQRCMVFIFCPGVY